MKCNLSRQIAQKVMAFDEIFRKCPKWEKEQVIWITVWIMWIQTARSVCVQDNSKTYGRILIKFLEYV